MDLLVRVNNAVATVFARTNEFYCWVVRTNQDKRSSQEVKGVPAIDTRQITTQVLANNGQTIVLGGIYERTKMHGVERIPFLSKIPIIGNLFKHRKWIDNKRELLIFVTPRILNEGSSIY